MAHLSANSGGPDQTLRSAASDLGLHCLRMTLSGVPRLKWVSLTPRSVTSDLGLHYFLKLVCPHRMFLKYCRIFDL